MLAKTGSAEGGGLKTEKTGSHYAYMLLCADGTVYSGYTTDPVRRTAAHNSGKGAKYTRSRRPVELVYQERFASKSEALKREAELKRLGRGEKLALIRDCRREPEPEAPGGKQRKE